MKRLYIAYSLLLITAAVCIFSIFYLVKGADTLIEQLEDVKSSFSKKESPDIINEKLTAIEKKWEKNHHTFAFFCPHYEIHEIDIIIKSLKDYYKSNEEGDFTAYSDVAIARLTQLKENELPTLANIL